MTKATEAVKKWLELETVGAFIVMQMYDVSPSEFWKVYKNIRGA